MKETLGKTINDKNAKGTGKDYYFAKYSGIFASSSSFEIMHKEAKNTMKSKDRALWPDGLHWASSSKTNVKRLGYSTCYITQ